jgi:hypothetical protein
MIKRAMEDTDASSLLLTFKMIRRAIFHPMGMAPLDWRRSARRLSGLERFVLAAHGGAAVHFVDQLYHWELRPEAAYSIVC